MVLVTAADRQRQDDRRGRRMSEIKTD